MNERRQTSGAGDFVAIFDLDLEVVEGTSATLDLADDAVTGREREWLDFIDDAVTAIGEGIEIVSRERKVGLHATLTRLAIHPVDSKPAKFRQLTAERVAAALVASDERG